MQYLNIILLDFNKVLSVYDNLIFNNIRANVIRRIPSYTMAIQFIQKTQNMDLPKFKKEYKSSSSKMLKQIR